MTVYRGKKAKMMEMVEGARYKIVFSGACVVLMPLNDEAKRLQDEGKIIYSYFQ